MAGIKILNSLDSAVPPEFARIKIYDRSVKFKAEIKQLFTIDQLFY